MSLKWWWAAAFRYGPLPRTAHLTPCFRQSTARVISSRALRRLRVACPFQRPPCASAGAGAGARSSSRIAGNSKLRQWSAVTPRRQKGRSRDAQAFSDFPNGSLSPVGQVAEARAWSRTTRRAVSWVPLSNRAADHIYNNHTNVHNEVINSNSAGQDRQRTVIDII